MKAIIVWGTQLNQQYNSALQAEPYAPVIMIESRGLSSKYKFHKQKLLLVLTAMRDFADELQASGRTVWYSRIDESDEDWFAELAKVCRKQKVTELVAMRASDRTPQQKLESWSQEQDIKLQTTPNTLFLTPTSAFNEWAEDQKQLRMERFYRWQRQRLDILMIGDKPQGERWNFDSENRKPLPKDEQPPQLLKIKPSPHAEEIKQVIKTYFNDHPGALETHWLPTNRATALQWLDDFVQNRFAKFGDYEDAMHKDETFLYHSVLSPLMNLGILHPSEIVDKALQADVPLAAKEGFIRQIIGWREFMFGLYNHKPIDWKDSNYFNHTKKLEDWWWTLDASKAPEPPLQAIFARLHEYGYNHHIERLMVLGNYMLLQGYAPAEVYDWFMTMYVDAYEWVMAANVIGMSQYADGGLDNGGFATKPYISGSNYLQKMGRWWPTAAAAKDSDWATDYWKFLERHHELLSSNYRLAPLLKRFRK